MREAAAPALGFAGLKTSRGIVGVGGVIAYGGLRLGEPLGDQFARHNVVGGRVVPVELGRAGLQALDELEESRQIFMLVCPHDLTQGGGQVGMLGRVELRRPLVDGFDLRDSPEEEGGQVGLEAGVRHRPAVEGFDVRDSSHDQQMQVGKLDEVVRQARSLVGYARRLREDLLLIVRGPDSTASLPELFPLLGRLLGVLLGVLGVPIPLALLREGPLRP